MNDMHEAEEVSIRTGVKAGDGPMLGSGGATGGNNGGDSDPSRGVIGSGT